MTTIFRVLEVAIATVALLAAVVLSGVAWQSGEWWTLFAWLGYAAVVGCATTGGAIIRLVRKALGRRADPELSPETVAKVEAAMKAVNDAVKADWEADGFDAFFEGRRLRPDCNAWSPQVQAWIRGHHAARDYHMAMRGRR